MTARGARSARGAISLAELANMSQVPEEPELTPEEEAEQAVAELEGGASGDSVAVSTMPAAEIEAAAEAPVVATAHNPELLPEDTLFPYEASNGETVQLNIPAGQRVREHAHQPTGIGVCALCKAMRAYETAIAPIRVRTLDADEEFSFELPNPAFESEQETTEDNSPTLAFESTIPAGSKCKLLNSDNSAHEHKAMPRTPSCAFCMVMNEASRSIQPVRSSTPRSSSGTTSEPRECRCMCGGMTKGGRYLPGHDARLAGRVRRFQEYLEENREALASGEVTSEQFPEFAQIPEDIRANAADPSAKCTCCDSPLLEPHESGMGPICRAGRCNCTAVQAARNAVPAAATA